MSGQLLVRRAVQDLDRPRAQDEQADRHPDDDREAADADIEAGAAEVRRVDARIGLEATAVRQVAREGYPAPWIWSGEAYGCGLRVGLFSGRPAKPVGLLGRRRERRLGAV